jgi:hypothetical protein
MLGFPGPFGKLRIFRCLTASAISCTRASGMAHGAPGFFPVFDSSLARFPIPMRLWLNCSTGKDGSAGNSPMATVLSYLRFSLGFRRLGSANGNRTRISSLKGMRANRCTIAPQRESVPRCLMRSNFSILPYFDERPLGYRDSVGIGDPRWPRPCARQSPPATPRGTPEHGV